MTSYLLLTFLLWPVLVLYTARLAWRYKSANYFRQRMGLASPSFDRSPVWLHCASVGEVNTLRPLLKLLLERFPQQPLLVTTNTVTGARVLGNSLGGNCQHAYLPIENYLAVTLFLNRVRPRLAIMMETEIWPLLYQQCRRRAIPISIINARLSARTLHSNRWIKARYREALGHVDHVLCRSATDQQAFISLGMVPHKTEVLGNLKFAQNLSTQPRTIDELQGCHYVLAASTHNNEEYLLARAWQAIDRQQRLLVIAPRHPERAASILQQLLPLQLNVAQRSAGQGISADTDIYLADTIGELAGFIQSADIVFMGGSLIPHGGQNLLEPASLGKPIIVGPHMHNFAAETGLLLEHQACIQLDSNEQLASSMEKLLADPNRQKQLGNNARTLMAAQGQIAERYLDKISTYYAELLAS